MIPSILLLDCSYELKERLERQGFSVSMGTIGFVNGIRSLPSQIYENEVIIYNPASIARGKGGEPISVDAIKDVTPEYSLTHLRDHILKGAVMLVFANHLGDGVDHNDVYEWIPFMPSLMNTKDNQFFSLTRFSNSHNEHMMLSYLDPNEISSPVQLKLKHKKRSLEEENGEDEEIEESGHLYERLETIPLVRNKNDETLGAALRLIQGLFFVLPTFKNNDDFIVSFLNKTISGLYGMDAHTSLIDDFISPEQVEAIQKNDELIAIQKGVEKELAVAREGLTQAKLKKVKIIKEDETATLILNYYGLARQQSDVALFFLYKVIELLERKYGNEAEAKKQLGNNEGWNLIGKIANASYGDVRHAPKPGEKVKQWSDDEIKSCFSAAGEIAKAYFSKLF